MQGVDHVILVAAAGKKLILRQYAVRLLKSGTKVRNRLSHTFFAGSLFCVPAL